MADMNTISAGTTANCGTGHAGCGEKGGKVSSSAKFEDAEGCEKTGDKQKAEGNDKSEGKTRKEAYQERQEIREGLNQLDAQLFELEQSGEVSHEDLKGIKEQYEALKERHEALKEPGEDRTKWSDIMLRPKITGKLLDGGGVSDKKFEQLDARIDRLENVAGGQEVSDRVPEGAIRVDHHYSGADDTLMDTSMVPLGKDADGFEQFVAFSPSEQTTPKAYFRDEAGNFTTNRNEAVKEFDGVATDPSILPDNAILDDKGNYWRASGADENGFQTFQLLRSGSDSMMRPAVNKTFYQDAEGNFSTLKDGFAGIKAYGTSIKAEDFEKSQWEPKVPEGAVAVNADGGGNVDFHMVSIGADENGQERYIAVQQERNATSPDQQIYTRNEDGSFETLDGEPMEALEKPERSMFYDRPVYTFSEVPMTKNGAAEDNN